MSGFYFSLYSTVVWILLFSLFYCSLDFTVLLILLLSRFYCSHYSTVVWILLFSLFYCCLDFTFLFILLLSGFHWKNLQCSMISWHVVSIEMLLLCYTTLWWLFSLYICFPFRCLTSWHLRWPMPLDKMKFTEPQNLTITVHWLKDGRQPGNTCSQQI